MIEDVRRTFVRSIFQGALIDWIGGWIVQELVLSPSGGWATHTH
jgi:hypothetical protein